MNIQEYINSQNDIDTLAEKLLVMCGKDIVAEVSQEDIAHLILIKTEVIIDILKMQDRSGEELDAVGLMDMTATILLGMMVKLNTENSFAMRILIPGRISRERFLMC